MNVRWQQHKWPRQTEDNQEVAADLKRSQGAEACPWNTLVRPGLSSVSPNSDIGYSPHATKAHQKAIGESSSERSHSIRC